jgi:hypothetical protein
MKMNIKKNDIDEKLAAKVPFPKDKQGVWIPQRHRDGTPIRDSTWPR